MSANPSDRRQRLRDQMKEFYGDPSASPRKTETKKSGVAPNVDMDSEYFDVSKYTTELLRRESLKGLVETDTELLRRVRRLDNELQELVYRNYAKFISATDTIREMHDNISEMDSKLQNLTSNVSNIDSLSQQLTNTLHVHRGKIEETVTVNRMMKKAQFLMGLPETMKKLIDKKEYNTCVKYWVAGDSFLKKHDTIPSIVRVRDECLGLAKNLYTKIEDNMCSYPLDDPEAMDTIRKFVEDLRLLRSTSVSISADDDSFEGTVQKALMRSVAANFASGTAAVQRDVKAALAVPDFSGMEYAKRDQPLAEVNVREALAQLKSVCALLSINSERVYALLYEEENQAVAMRVAQEVQPVLIDLLPVLAQLLVPFVNASITAVADEAGAILLSKEKHDTVPHMLSAVVSALLKQLKQLSITLKQLGANYLDTAHSHQSTAYGEMVDKCVVQVLSGVADLLHQKLYEAPTAEAVGRAVGPLRKDDLFVVMPEGKKARREQIAFSLSRYAYASLAALLEENIRTQLVSGEVMSKDSTTEISAQLENVAKVCITAPSS
ncbi:hypothetical protein AGDE_11064 [Angomonas deanei]|uniref:Vacuolar protein sorting-associated protein 51 homolog n=1 Tax=Angomonas deanei TaxID=59799 RepID=A0A7G2CQU3_9TRYP|nr:hypothetical protein AGDE_11064 [Angomonas deanei]CAD2220873.1 Vps51/Vps67/COG (conserved oligomeric Golgi) complex component, COG2/Vps53-like, N-terminal/Dor1-like family/Exocyst complex component Sec5, putative [Angomonas deanei]|eukprot:EPY26843.1 hypothetical protein AGDE_11064 [Angomonas deanei]